MKKLDLIINTFSYVLPYYYLSGKIVKCAQPVKIISDLHTPYNY